MKIIITMAGFGNRFKSIGIQKPKHEIIARDQSLFRWSLLSLSDFFDCEFIFITRKDAYSYSFIDSECKSLGISSFKVAEVDVLTDGQASSALLADPFLDNMDAICIFNIDTYIDPGVLLKKNIVADAAGYLPAFVAEGSKWSFVKTESPESLKVIEVSEKVRISDLGTVGFYYFRRWSDYKRIYTDHRNVIREKYKETYVAPMYQFLIEEGQLVYTDIIEVKHIHVLGTPEDIAEFDPDYLQYNIST